MCALDFNYLMTQPKVSLIYVKVITELGMSITRSAGVPIIVLPFLDTVIGTDVVEVDPQIPITISFPGFGLLGSWTTLQPALAII